MLYIVLLCIHTIFYKNIEVFEMLQCYNVTILSYSLIRRRLHIKQQLESLSQVVYSVC